MCGFCPSICVTKTLCGYYPYIYIAIIHVSVWLLSMYLCGYNIVWPLSMYCPSICMAKTCVPLVHALVWLCNESWEFTRAFFG